MEMELSYCDDHKMKSFYIALWIVSPFGNIPRMK